MRVSVYKQVLEPQKLKKQLLNWAQQFREITFLDSNNYQQTFSSFDCLLAVDAFTAIQTDCFNAFEDLKQYQQTTKDWLFGYLSYDLKNDTENLSSKNFDGLHFPDLYFFQPKKLFILKGNRLEIQYLLVCDDELESDFNEIQAITFEEGSSKMQQHEKTAIKQRISKELYFEKIKQVLEHIHRGDIYEANFCMEFFAENAIINPFEKFEKLNQISQAPFATFFKNNHFFVLSASPERYLRKTGQEIISQPIKGTSKRFENPIEDQESKIKLQNDTKERSENIMITDLVRNDLSKTAQKNSVEVTELCQIYSFLQVHQMISTVKSQLNENYDAISVLKTTFPMGSMTGAPKVSVMKIMEELELTKRGLYSGAIGYFTPNSDFDFNVVIRSILFNSKSQYLSFSVGSAITAMSQPNSEYEECLLKAKAMFEVLQ
ncbi:anthranilate synthase component I family protein [Flavobacterium agrisoli]|uniref:Anthranilate synthase component I family protein n=1 Tax=Flavobacterium agrisoli TaxID=2793066 RepID=A0A934PJW9_9FLAO|nr:anthranilate synthase component I family protein [Flavobacterium agrisoli]MBK0368962.1 anthranilate synthase component I family protein [Flavobacterium agrisoli]